MALTRWPALLGLQRSLWKSRPQNRPVRTDDDLHVPSVAAVFGRAVRPVGVHAVGGDERAVQQVQPVMPGLAGPSAHGRNRRRAWSWVRGVDEHDLAVRPRIGGAAVSTVTEAGGGTADQQGLLSGVVQPPDRPD